jgi:hypothetical protein
MFCQVTTEACLENKKLNSEDIESEVEHREVPTEEAAVKYSGTMKKRQKKLTRGDFGSWRKLAAACRKVFHRAAVARRKRNVFRKIQTQGNGGLRKE